MGPRCREADPGEVIGREQRRGGPSRYGWETQRDVEGLENVWVTEAEVMG